VVHDTFQAIQTVLRRRLRGTFSSLAVLTCCVALLGGCGSVSQGSTLAQGSTSGPHSSIDVGESARSDTCEQWQAGTIAQRYGALLRLRKFASSPVGSSSGLQNGHVLTDKRAYKLFESFCSKHFARAFKLYKLYERAAAFIGHQAN
jgi:hypothetical protein